MRDLTTIGRILIVKTLAIIPFHHYVIRSVEKLIYGIVWKGKRDKVKQRLAKLKKEVLVKMPDIQSKIKATQVMWIKRFFTTEKSIWKDISPFGKGILFHCNYDPMILKESLQS